MASNLAIRSLGQFLCIFGRQLPTTVGSFIAWHPKHSLQLLHTVPELQTMVAMNPFAFEVSRRVQSAILDDA